MPLSPEQEALCERLDRVRRGAFYGWPYSYIGQQPQPGFAKRQPEKVTVAPDLLFEAHSSAMDILFYDGAQFPAEYRGDALVALKGSWNRSQPTGYKVVRVPFKDGKPQGYYQNFATGFWVSGQNSRRGLGPTDSSRHHEGWFPPHRGRHWRNDLARFLQWA